MTRTTTMSSGNSIANSASAYPVADAGRRKQFRADRVAENWVQPDVERTQ